MSKGAFFSIIGALVLFSSLERCFGQKNTNQSVRLLFYNVENLFDTEDDTLTADNDFLPGGSMKWTVNRYNSKLNSIYKVITASGEWDPPVIIGLCEVENRSVLLDLLNNTYLLKYSYGIIHKDSQDPRGIDVALIFRKDKAQLINYRYCKPNDISNSEFRTRSVLYSKWLILGDTLHLFLNHWPSRRGGALSGEKVRNSVAQMVRSLCDSILDCHNGKAKIVLAGDFNCVPEDNDILLLEKSQKKGSEKNGYSFLNLSEESAEAGYGSYKFSGNWEMVDQVLVSEFLLKSDSGFFTNSDSFKVFKAGFLLKEDPSYPGMYPFPTYRAFKYLGGFSDHLPVILDLRLR
jgi:predicted extracellular nuclease